MKKKIFSVLLCITVFFATTTPAPAEAWSDIGALAQRVVQWAISLPGTIASMGQLAYDVAKDAVKSVSGNTLLLNKMLALLAVQQGAKLFMGGGDGLIVRDWNKQLYASPQQRAMAQMNMFFNSVSKGRLSSLNYEGVNGAPNYDAYLVAQARTAISGQQFSTNLQQQVSDPRNGMFSGGNMRGIMTFFECANNPYCYTLVAQNKYNVEYAKAQDLARSEVVNGFLPTKDSSGRIKSPAMLAQSAFTQIDQMGTQMIMNAQPTPTTAGDLYGVSQVWAGAAISLGGRLINYGIADNAGKEAIRNKNDEFPFSLGYSTNGGLGVSAGGVTASTGVGAISGCKKVGNTNACMGVDVNRQGGRVQSSTQKTN